MGTIVARKTRAGSVRYRAQVRVSRDGHCVSESRTFSREAMAKEWMRRRERELEGSDALAAAAHHGVTWRVVLMRYHAEACAGYGRSKKMAIKALASEALADKNILTMKASDYLEHIRARRAAGVAPSTANGDLVWLRIVARYARTAWNIPVSLDQINDAAQQARASRLTAKSRRRTRVPTADELRLLQASLEVVRPRSKMPMVLVMWWAIYSCRRLSELASIRRDEIDWEAKVYRVRDIKHPLGSHGNTKEARMTPMCALVMREIIRRVPDRDGRVLPFTDSAVGNAWQEVCRLIGVVDLHFHDLRHEGASRLAEDGLTIPQMQAVTLHESWSSLQIYVNMASRRRERVDYWSA